MASNAARARPVPPSVSGKLSTPPTGTRAALALGIPILAAAIAAFTYRDTLTYFFSQDAFTVLARVRGLAAMPGLGWRWLSGDLYFRLGDRLFGLDPLPYRVIALLLHAVNAGLVVVLARRLGLHAAAALFAAAFFASHYAHFDALYSVAGAGELMAALFALIAMIVALPREPDHAGWRAPLAVLCYVVGLSSKENVLLLPVLIGLAARLRPSPARAAVLPMAALGALYVVRFVAMNPFGAWGAGAGANAYKLSLGPALFETWSTYLAWSLALFDTRWGHLVNELGHEPRGFWLTGLLVVLLYSLWRKRKSGAAGESEFQAAMFGTAGYAAFILPVLPLAGHATHQYLYLPIGMIGIAMAAGLQAWVPRRFELLIWLLALLLAWFGVVMVQSIELARLPGTTLPRQGTVSRAVVARRVFEELPAAPAPPPAELELLGPNALTPTGSPDTSALARYLYHNFSAALDQGQAVRLRFPDVRVVRLHPDLDATVHMPDVIVFGYDGSLRRGPAAWLFLRRAQVEWSAGRPAESLAALARAEEMTQRWLGEVAPGPWREEGVSGIRGQAQAMQQALERGPAPAPGAAAAQRDAYRDALRRILERVE